MDAIESKTIRRLKKSREKWKRRAIESGEELRELRRTVKILRISRDSWRKKYLARTRNIVRSPCAGVKFVEISSSKNEKAE